MMIEQHETYFFAKKQTKRNWRMDETKNPADSIMNEHIDTDITEENLVSIKLVKNSYMVLQYM